MGCIGCRLPQWVCGWLVNTRAIRVVLASRKNKPYSTEMKGAQENKKHKENAVNVEST